MKKNNEQNFGNCFLKLLFIVSKLFDEFNEKHKNSENEERVKFLQISFVFKNSII